MTFRADGRAPSFSGRRVLESRRRAEAAGNVTGNGGRMLGHGTGLRPKNRRGAERPRGDCGSAASGGRVRRRLRGEDLEKRKQGLREEKKKLRELAQPSFRPPTSARRRKGTRRARHIIGAADHCHLPPRFERGARGDLRHPVRQAGPSGSVCTRHREAGNSPAPPTGGAALQKSRQDRPRAGDQRHSSAPRTAPPRGSKP